MDVVNLSLSLSLSLPPSLSLSLSLSQAVLQVAHEFAVSKLHAVVCALLSTSKDAVLGASLLIYSPSHRHMAWRPWIHCTSCIYSAQDSPQAQSAYHYVEHVNIMIATLYCGHQKISYIAFAQTMRPSFRKYLLSGSVYYI